MNAEDTAFHLYGLLGYSIYCERLVMARRKRQKGSGTKLMEKEIIQLNEWLFAPGNDAGCLAEGKMVTLPHTWNIEAETEELRGSGWYEYRFPAKPEWRHGRVRVRFHAVYRDAVIYINGTEIGEHRNSGYTSFMVELTNFLKYDTENTLTVHVRNDCSETALPYKRSFDWADDGGLIRGVRMIVTGKNYIQACSVCAKPVILETGKRMESGNAIFGADITIDCTDTSGQADTRPLSLQWVLYRGCDSVVKRVAEGRVIGCRTPLRIPHQYLSAIDYWHFDCPRLYTLKLILTAGDETEDVFEQVFGFRDFRIQGSRFLLNGEYVRLCGTEWMPGSNPEYGMAEPAEYLEKMLLCLKESNCVFTRFHWQQDDAVYDWCDRHGMLVQEEVPFWGPDPEIPGEDQWNAFQMQIAETVEAHRNHPSIIAWGVGNELKAQSPATIQYIKDAVALSHSLDPDRPASYVSNTFHIDGRQDGTIFGDMMMINDYIGTWTGPLDQHDELKKMIRCNPGKPLIPSEFGLCEPFWKGGDARRTQIFLEKMNAYREYPEIAGTINFCLNDYRTQMGEDGEGKLKKRIHGSTDLYGVPKASYYTVQKECAPYRASRDCEGITITCRSTLPAYTMIGYCGEIKNSGGQVTNRVYLPDLAPQDAWRVSLSPGETLSLFRPTGDWTGTF